MNKLKKMVQDGLFWLFAGIYFLFVMLIITPLALLNLYIGKNKKDYKNG